MKTLLSAIWMVGLVGMAALALCLSGCAADPDVEYTVIDLPHDPVGFCVVMAVFAVVCVFAVIGIVSALADSSAGVWLWRKCRKRIGPLLVLLACGLCLSGCMEMPEGHGPGPVAEESALAKEIRATGLDRQSATNYADLFDGMAHLCGSPQVKTTEDLKRAQANGREIIGQGHSEALVPIADREFACLKDPKPLDESLRSQCRQAFERFAAAMHEVSR